MRSAGRASRARDQHGMLNRKAADPCLRFDNAGNLQLHLTSDVGIVEIAARRRNGHDFTKSAGPWVAMWYLKRSGMLRKIMEKMLAWRLRRRYTQTHVMKLDV
jgi:hypothetical protein